MKEDDLELSVFSETKEKKFDTTDIIKLKKQFKDTVLVIFFQIRKNFRNYMKQYLEDILMPMSWKKQE